MVTVPEAPMHEDGDPEARKHDIRSSRKILPMQAESVSERMKLSSDGQLDRGVLSADAGHQSTAFLGSHDVGTHVEPPAKSERRESTFVLRPPEPSVASAPPPEAILGETPEANLTRLKRILRPDDQAYQSTSHDREGDSAARMRSREAMRMNGTRLGCNCLDLAPCSRCTPDRSSTIACDQRPWRQFSPDAPAGPFSRALPSCLPRLPQPCRGGCLPSAVLRQRNRCARARRRNRSRTRRSTD